MNYIKSKLICYTLFIFFCMNFSGCCVIGAATDVGTTAIKTAASVGAATVSTAYHVI